MAQDLAGLNSLRQALTPYEDVKFELNLNRHPKAHKDKSLIYAENMKLSNDGSVLENEEDFIINNTIQTLLSSYYSNNFEIIHIIPCNTELVLFVREANSNNFQIWRYREKNDNYGENFALFYNKAIPYNYGEFSGTFTYTSNDSLIIAFCEYPTENSGDFMSPMMTINLGTHTKGYIDSDGYTWVSNVGEFNDRLLEPYKLPICPEIILPQVLNVSKTKGNSYIGTYYVYIRYKINKYDYTQWFSIGYPLINEHLQDNTIFNKITTNIINKSDNNYEDLIGASPTLNAKKLNTYVNQNTDLINNCFNLDIHHTNILYDYCQIGFICIAKTYTKYYITSDLKLQSTINLTTNINSLKEEIFNTSIYENYYNVKNIVNKDNKLYIANYKTFNPDVSINVDDVKLSIKKTGIIKNNDEETAYITINGIKFDKKDLIKLSYHDIPIITDQWIQNQGYVYKYYTTRVINLPLFLKYHGIEECLVGNKVRASYYENGANHYVDTDIKDTKICSTTAIVSGKVGPLNGSVIVVGAYYNTNQYSTWGYNIKQGVLVDGSAMCDLNSISIGILDGNGVVHYLTFNRDDIYFDNVFKCKLKDTSLYNPIDDLYNNHYYYNNLNNAINNNILTSLCKGEVYDFYIHFIDKYGNITNGHKLTNYDGIHSYFKDNNNNLVKEEICFANNVNDGNTTNSNIYVFSKNTKLFAFNGTTWEVNNNINITQVLNNNYLILDTTETEITNYTGLALRTAINFVTNHVANLLKLPENDFKDLTYGDIFDTQPPINNTGLENTVKFIKWYNSENELFFKVPTLADEEGDVALALDVNISALSKYGDYVSYFITHKKLEKTYVLNGIGNQNQLNDIILNNKFESSAIVKRYPILDINWKSNLIKCTLQTDIMHMNKCEYYPNLLNKLAYAEDAQLNRDGRNTTLYLSDVTVDFTGDFLPKDENLNNAQYGVYFLEMINVNKNKYINDSNLYRLGNIMYISSTIYEGLNGIYNKHITFKYGTKDNNVTNLLSNNGEGIYGDVYLYEYFNFYDDNELCLYLSEKAICHKIPQKFGNTYNGILGTDIFYRPITTLNLFNYKITNIYDTWINFYNKFNPNNDYLNEFNRTIYRSQVISDEGRTNNWRWFENNAYKNIEENKGNIVNLLPIGNYLYVHTEHSLYAFSEDNTLSMNNQNLQVATPDIFDTEYKEVFISKLGYGGIQDKHAWVSGQFGYMWYNNDTKQIFKVYGNSMDIISKDIQEFLENQNIQYVRFANDIKNNRVLINIRIKNGNDDQNIPPEEMYKDYVLSYNILSKTFISFHDYNFNKTYNTKLELYFLQNKNTEIHQFIEDVYGFNINKEKRYYKAYFIVNPYYKEIKYLEYFIYKLRKRKVKNHAYISSFSTGDFINYPVEKILLPYPGQSIRVFNDLVDTVWNNAGTVDPVTNMPNNEIQNYNEPYWDLGNWNFNYLRDTQKYPNNTFGSNPEARLFGNYFIIAFNFGHVTELIEFESLDTNLTQDKNL